MQHRGLALMALAACVALPPSEDPNFSTVTLHGEHILQTQLYKEKNKKSQLQVLLLSLPVIVLPVSGWQQLHLPTSKECWHTSCLLIAILPIASSCCTQVSHHISRRLLERVNTCRIQRADGDCDLAAIILHIKHRRICVSPHNHTIKQWLKEQAAKKNAKGNICHMKKLHPKRNGDRTYQAKQETNGHKTH